MFFCTDPPPTSIYTLSLHDALPIFSPAPSAKCRARKNTGCHRGARAYRIGRARSASLRRLVLSDADSLDRKSTRLNSSHEWISYAVFCLKKKKHTVRTKRKG